MSVPLSATELHHAIQSLTNVVYLTKIDAGDEVKVRKYMTDAEEQLSRLKKLASNFVPPTPPQQIN
jgi:hypothetical protein